MTVRVHKRRAAGGGFRVLSNILIIVGAAGILDCIRKIVTSQGPLALFKGAFTSALGQVSQAHRRPIQSCLLIQIRFDFDI